MFEVDQCVVVPQVFDVDQCVSVPQVVGGQNMDRLTVAVAADLEAGFGGWRCPAQIL